MSYSWMVVRGGSSNPSSLKFQALMNKQNIAENELFKPDQLQPKSISASTEDSILVQDPFTFTKLKNKNLHYSAPFEPDGKYLRFWCRFNHLGKTIKDEAFVFRENTAGLYNPIIAHGSPKLCKGPDDGVKGGKVVTQLNSDPDFLDYYSVLNPEEHNVGIMPAQDLGMDGFSLYIEFMIEGDPVQDNGQDPTIWYHTDDVNGDYGTCVRVGTNRELIFIARRNAVTRNFQSPNNIIQSKIWYRACFTYTFSGDLMVMRIDNISQADSGNPGQTFDGIDNSIFMGAQGGDPVDSGRFRGRLADVRWYNFPFWNQHMDNIWNNGRSVCATDVVLFDGATNQTIDCTNDATLWSLGLTKFSWSAWVYPTLIDVTNRAIMAHGTGASRFNCEIKNGGIAAFAIRNIANTTFSTAESTAVMLNKWNHIAGTYDKDLGSANVKIFVGGALGATTANLTETVNSSATLTIGGGPFGDFQGYMKDYRWWTTRALTETEVTKVRDNISDAPLPNYWLRLNEGSGNPIDWITRTKIGTLTNGPLWKIGSSPRPTEFGSLSVAGYARFNDTIDTGGYDSVGFDSTGFDTT